jgi:hypothetical protein
MTEIVGWILGRAWWGKGDVAPDMGRDREIVKECRAGTDTAPGSDVVLQCPTMAGFIRAVAVLNQSGLRLPPQGVGVEEGDQDAAPS